jgi:SAM-dependent methyltransferase
MNRHSQRWGQAQQREAEYWKKGNFTDSESKEIEAKYSNFFHRVEEKYQFDEKTSILDLGCGATCASVLFKKGIKYGVDPLADEFLQRDMVKLEGKIRIFQGTGEYIPFGENFFSVVLCRNALDHMDDVQRVMQEVKRVVKRGGILLLSVYTYAPFIAFLKMASEFIPCIRNVEHPHTFTRGKLVRLCEKYFDILEEEIIFEGKSSIDYGKQDVELKEPLLNKIISFINARILMKNWFVREYMLICMKT